MRSVTLYLESADQFMIGFLGKISTHSVSLSMDWYAYRKFFLENTAAKGYIYVSGMVDLQNTLVTKVWFIEAFFGLVYHIL